MNKRILIFFWKYIRECLRAQLQCFCRVLHEPIYINKPFFYSPFSSNAFFYVKVYSIHIPKNIQAFFRPFSGDPFSFFTQLSFCISFFERKKNFFSSPGKRNKGLFAFPVRILFFLNNLSRIILFHNHFVQQEFIAKSGCQIPSDKQSRFQSFGLLPVPLFFFYFFFSLLNVSLISPRSFSCYFSPVFPILCPFLDLYSDLPFKPRCMGNSEAKTNSLFRT